MWVWGNPNLKLTPDNRNLAETVRKLGRTFGIPAFNSDGQVSCDELLGPDLSPVAAHVFASIVVGELGFDAYYSMPFDYGRFVVVIRDKRLQSPAPNPVARILTIFPDVISTFPVLDQQAAFVGYTQSYGLVIEEKPRSVRVLLGGKDVMQAKFDHAKRMTELNGIVSPTSES